MRWRIKSFAQRILSNVSGGKTLYYYLQKNIGGFRDFSVTSKLSQGLRLISALYSLGYHVRGKNTLEIGTGWYPVIPMLFHILGQQACFTFDIERFLKAELSLKAAKELASLGQDIAERVQEYEYKVDHERLISLTTPNTLPELLNELNIFYFAPADACSTHLDSHSIDIAFSNTTLEHIPQSQLRELFLETRKVLCEDGVMLHLVDCSDHYSHSDESISAINFLQFSDQEWAQHNNEFLYQNRLRPSSYRRLAQEAGLDVTIFDACVSDYGMSNLHSFPLAEEFLNLPPDEICSTSFILMGKRKT